MERERNFDEFDSSPPPNRKFRQSYAPSDSAPSPPAFTRSGRRTMSNINDGMVTPRRLTKEQSLTEKRLRLWIEESLDLKFIQPPRPSEQKSTDSPLKKAKEESTDFYFNLESGVLLCKLLQRYYPSTINMTLVHEFPERMYMVSQDKDRMRASNYISHAKSNVRLFLDGVRRIDGFPVLATFSFEDLFLQQNKQAILGCLSNLHLFASKPEEEEDEEDEEMAEAEEDIAMITGGVANRPMLDPIQKRDEFLEQTSPTTPSPTTTSPTNASKPLPPVPTKTSPSSPTDGVVSRPPSVKPSAANAPQSISRTMINVLSLPFVIMFVIVVTASRLYLATTGRGADALPTRANKD